MSKIKEFIRENAIAIGVVTTSVVVVGVAAYAVNKTITARIYVDAYDKLFDVIRDLGGDPEQLLQDKYMESITKTMTS